MLLKNTRTHNYIGGNILLKCNILIDRFGHLVYPYNENSPIINLDGSTSTYPQTPICFQVVGNNNKHYVYCNPHYIQFLMPTLQHFDLNKCILFTGSSDHLINNTFLSLIENNNILHWFGLNVAIKHTKVTPIPLGIRIFAYEEIELFDKYTKLCWDGDIEKTKLCNANFHLISNEAERKKCLRQCKDIYTPNTVLITEVEDYGKDSVLKNYRTPWHQRLASAYFEISPRGFSMPLSNQGDNHKLWEALYHKTIPVTTPSPLTDYYSKIFPMVIIDDWDNFSLDMLSVDLYNKLWEDHPEAEKYLQFDYFFENIIEKKCRELLNE